MKSARMPSTFSQLKEHARRALRMYGPIAQLVEQLAFNQWVAGSSPARLTIFTKQKHEMRMALWPAAFFLCQICGNSPCDSLPTALLQRAYLRRLRVCIG